MERHSPPTAVSDSEPFDSDIACRAHDNGALGVRDSALTFTQRVEVVVARNRAIDTSVAAAAR